MYRYPVKLTIKSAAAIEGVAIDTQRNELKEECPYGSLAKQKKPSVIY